MYLLPEGGAIVGCGVVVTEGGKVGCGVVTTGANILKVNHFLGINQNFINPGLFNFKKVRRKRHLKQLYSPPMQQSVDPVQLPDGKSF